jgi:protein O-GlcNAc transferase
METVYINNNNISIWVHSNSRDYVSYCIKEFKRFYEEDLLNYLCKTFPKHENIIDIGANIGNHSLFFSTYFDCKKVYAFEPFEKNINLFRENLKDALENNRCILYDTALSDKEETKILYNSEHENYGGLSLHKQAKSFVVEEKINVKTLDSFDISDVSFIKIDVENHENEVLIGGRETIMKYKPVICLENSNHFFAHLFPDPEPHKVILEGYGYKKFASNVCNSGMDIWVSA